MICEKTVLPVYMSHSCLGMRVAIEQKKSQVDKNVNRT